MIIFGTNAKETNAQPSNLCCPGCDAQGSTRFTIYQKYFYLYWIPVFPTGTEAISQCTNCMQTTEEPNMLPAVRHSYTELLEENKTPIYHYAGLFIIGLFVIWLMIFV